MKRGAHHPLFRNVLEEMHIPVVRRIGEGKLLATVPPLSGWAAPKPTGVFKPILSWQLQSIGWSSCIDTSCFYGRPISLGIYDPLFTTLSAAWHVDISSHIQHRIQQNGSESCMEVRQIPATDLESRLTLYQHLHEVDEPLPDPKVVKASWRTLLSNPRT